MGYKVILLTKRPIYGKHPSENTYTETAKWLRDNAIDFDVLICTNDESKAYYLKEYNCEYIIENDPAIFKDIEDHFCFTTPILIRKPYNRSYEIHTNHVFINSIYDFYMMLATRRHEELGG